MSALLSRCDQSTRHDYGNLGFNLLSVAILQEDEEEVEFLAMKYPSYGMEVNYCGQPPIHRAVLVVNLRILSLLTEQVNPEALNIADNIQRETAEYAMSLGFDKGAAFIDVFRCITSKVIRRRSLGWPSPWYIDWVIDGDGDLTSVMSLDFMPGVAQRVTWAHYLMAILGYKARYYPYKLYDNILPPSVATVVFSDSLCDDCRCHCSLQGCTPLIKFLEGFGCRRRYPRTPFTLTENARSLLTRIQALTVKEHETHS
ncbi:hypothetical protein FOXYSP1_18016 [Fusarium oxysporum f. sp. phaseoli]